MAALAATFKMISLDGEVRDGPAVGDASAREVITVGYVGPDDDESVSDSTGTGGLGPERENYDVHCAVAVQSGDENVAAVRVRVFELLAGCGQRLVLNPRLGGACMQARISSWALREDMSGGGVLARIRFEVSVDAFTTT
jgi:hypothetical protein